MLPQSYPRPSRSRPHLGAAAAMLRAALRSIAPAIRTAQSSLNPLFSLKNKKQRLEQLTGPGRAAGLREEHADPRRVLGGVRGASPGALGGIALASVREVSLEGRRARQHDTVAAGAQKECAGRHCEHRTA